MNKEKIIFMKLKASLGPCLIPAYKSDKEKFDKLPYNKAIQFSRDSDRMITHHRKLFAIFKLVVENDQAEQFKKPEHVLSFCKFKSGHTVMIKHAEEIYEIPDSISFEAMSQAKFEEFYKKAVPICAEYLGCEIEELDANYYEFM